MPILVLSQPGGGVMPLAGEASFTAQSALVTVASALFVAQSNPDPVTGTVGFTAQSLPLLPALAREAVVYSSSLTGLPGTVLSWEYTHNGEAEELSVVVVGLYGMGTPMVTLSAEARTESGTLLASLPSRSFSAIGQEPQEDVGANRTTFRFRNSFTRALRGNVLPELIPWKGQPTPDPCLGVRQKISVSGLVNGVLSGSGVSFESDPLAGAYFEEGRYEFSTLGMTAQGLWDATYGALGMTLQASGGQGASSLVGRFPGPISGGSGAVIPEEWITSLTQGRELLQTPAAVTVRGGDYFEAIDVGQILDWLGADPASAEINRELLPNQEWIEPTESAGTARTQRGYKKSGGQMVSTIEITTDDIEVTETVDGQPFSKLWNGVATGYKRTTMRYDPICPGRPMSQVTESRAWAFDAQTQSQSFSTSGPGLYRNLTVGDLASDELAVTTYRYSPQGFLIAKTTNTRRLASLKQRDAELSAEDRGPLEAREYISTTQTEQWQPIGGGRWLYSPGVSGQTLVPVYDTDSGDAIRTASITRSAPDAPRVTDQAPPSYDCSTCTVKYVQYPTGVTLASGDAGFADAAEVSLNFLPPSLLGSVANAVMANSWGRVVTELTVPLPLGYFSGDWTSYGQVRELRVGQAEGDPTITTTLTAAAPDSLLGSASGVAVSDLNVDQNTGQAIMLAGRPGGALARVSTGWNASAGLPKIENAFISFRSGFPPRPGDEIQWQLIRGQREAVNAR